jgi:hypothetical protein
MPQKIFISYRREDAGANALGISQYLEKEFGRKNVFIDVDMRAGAKFPVVLEQRLAECKVLLALIGPEWLNSRSEDGQRRIDLPDDWVRLEIAQALKRDITVIPVRVSGTPLPSKGNLPEDIRGLLDHQAVSLTLAGFRHEMSGLVRDIRAIPSPRPWRRFGVIAAGFVCLLAALAAVWAFFHLGSFSQQPKTAGGEKTESKNVIWSSSPGEWVLFGGDKVPGVGYYFKPSASRKFGDHAVLYYRNPFKPADTPGPGLLGAYEDVRTVIDCKNHNFANAETIIYNKASEIISHYKQAEPEALTPAAFNPILLGSVLTLAERIACDESLATSLGDQAKNVTYLSVTPTQDGDMFNGPPKKLSTYHYEVLMATKWYQDRPLAGLFAIKPLLNYPYTYRSLASLLHFSCMDDKIQPVKSDAFDAQGNLVYIHLLDQEFDLKEGSPFRAVKSGACGATATDTSDNACILALVLWNSASRVSRTASRCFNVTS